MMYMAACALLYCPDRSLDVTHMLFCGYHVQYGGAYSISSALEFIVHVELSHCQISGMVYVDDSFESLFHFLFSCFKAVDGLDRAEFVVT